MGLAAIVLVATSATSCAGSSEPASPTSGTSTEAERVERPDPIGEPLDLTGAGFHELPEPPTPIEWDTARVWTGEELVIWGGVAAETDSSPGTMITAGATLSLDDGRWTPMPASPFPEGLYHPLAAFDGTEVILIGTQCEGEVPAATDGGAPACPKGPAAAAWSPDTGAWRTLPAPPIPMDDYVEERVVNGGTATASGAGSALFAFGYDTTVLSWDREAEAWSEVPAPWDDGTAIAVSADPVTPQLVAAMSEPRSGTTVGERPVQLWALAPGADRWASAGSPTFDPVATSTGEQALISNSFEPGGEDMGVIIHLDGQAPSPIREAPEGPPGSVVAMGEWIFERPFGPDADDRTERARRIDADRWVDLDLPTEWEPELYVGDGVVGAVPYAGGFGFWHAPEELAG